MSDKRYSTPSDLRAIAEATLASATIEVPAMTDVETKKLIHDLRVHQIELEMQNEELRASRNELELARDDYARLYNQSPIGYISLDKNGMVSKANQTFLDMVGSNMNIKNRPFTDFLIDQSADIFMGRFGAFFRQPEGKIMDLVVRGPDRTIVARLSARREKAGESLLVAVIDISEQAKAEVRINTLLEEKQLLLREVHHRIKNNMNVMMSLLSIQSDKMDNAAASASLDAARGRMMSMLVIYDRLYRSDNFVQISTRTYLSELLDMIRQQFESLHVVIDKNLDDFNMDSSVLFPLGIILNELITNSFKYAFKNIGSGSLSVRLHKEEGETATLSVSDDGVGLPAGFSWQDSNGFGFLLVRSLVSQIHGSMNVGTTQETGARFDIQFPTADKIAPQQVSSSTAPPIRPGSSR